MHHLSYGINEKEVEKYIEEILKNYLYLALQHPLAYPYFLCSVYKFLFARQEIVVSTNSSEKHTIIQTIGKYLNSESVFSMIDSSNLKEMKKYNFSLSLLQNKDTNKDLSIFICENFQCNLPLYSWEEFDTEKIL